MFYDLLKWTLQLAFLYSQIGFDALGIYHVSSPFINKVNCTIRSESAIEIIKWPSHLRSGYESGLTIVYENYTLALPMDYPKKLEDSMNVTCFFHSTRKSLVIPRTDVVEDYLCAVIIIVFSALICALLTTAAVIIRLQIRRLKRKIEEE